MRPSRCRAFVGLQGVTRSYTRVLKGFSRRLKALLDYTGLRRLRSDKALALRLQEVDGLCIGCRVPAGSECYYCWDERRRGEEKLTQKDVDEKCKDKTYNDKHIERRRERIKGRKVASRADVANQIESKKGAYRNNFDEGHFYFLEDFLALIFSGKYLPHSRPRSRLSTALSMK